MLSEIDETERLSAKISLDALRDLAAWWFFDAEPQMSPPLCLGWDMHRLWPSEGFALWRELMLRYEPPLLSRELLDGEPRESATTMEQYEACLVEQWALYTRPKHFTDSLIVDVLSDEKERGYEPCGCERTEAILEDLAAKVGAKRATEQAEREARARRYKDRLDSFYELDDAGYAKWIADGRPDGVGIKFERWYDRRFNERLANIAAKPAVPPPAEVIDRLRRERDAQLGPLPNHPELPMHQAEALSRWHVHLPSGKVVDERTGELCAPSSIDKHLGRIKKNEFDTGPGIQASTWLSQYRFVHSLGWLPGEPRIIHDKVLTQKGWLDSPGDKTFNLYFPSTVARIAGDILPWLDHIKRVYPNEAAHIVYYLASKVQHPGVKINHGLVFIGAPGIGKDTILEPAIAAVGAHNFQSVNATSFFNSQFNGYLKSVLLRIDEVHDLGGESKYAFHDRTKTILAAPPESHSINEKFIPAHQAANVCGVVLTSNHPDALYLERGDRRHFVCTSDRTASDFGSDYFDALYRWFAYGGNEAVAHYLSTLDLSAFNAKAPPPKTAGWFQMVAAGMAPEQNDLTDAIETLGDPAALHLGMLTATGMGVELAASLTDPKRRRNLPKRLAEAGYVPVGNPDDKSGRWRIGTVRVLIYGRQELSEPERLAAARAIVASAPGTTTPPIPVR